MDCGVPFCHTGCPLNNIIPDWNDLVYHGRWHEAVRVLHCHQQLSRSSPAASVPRRAKPPACSASTSRRSPSSRSKRPSSTAPSPKAGSLPSRRRNAPANASPSSAPGPPGLAAAQQLRRAGHAVTVFEKTDRIGGLLRYGIPNFKMEKHLIDRRLEQMRAEGVEFVTNAHVGGNIPVEDLRRDFDAILLAGGAEQPRDLKVPGRELKGIHFAMEFLPQQNRAARRSRPERDSATGKRVVIIGGGDTGADCLGTSHRQKALSVHQFELLPQAARRTRSPSTPWPLWPMQLRTESSHEEGGMRDWSIATTGFTGDEQGNVKQLHAVRVGPPPKFEPLAGTEFTLDADLVLLAMGFLGPVKTGLLDESGREAGRARQRPGRRNYMTSVPGVFAAGDMRRGQSLVVWAIAEGRQAARGVDQYLMGSTKLP